MAKIDVDILYERIKNGSKLEKDAALDQLYNLAEENNQSPESLNELALGLQMAKKFTESINIFEQLVRAFPNEDLYRLNLATTYGQIPEIELCKYHLTYLVEHGSTEEIRKLAQQQLSGYLKFIGEDKRDQSLRQLQLDTLRSNIDSGRGNLDDYHRLGRLLLQMHHKDSSEHWLDDATSVLEKGHECFPNDSTIMENLVLCYLYNGQDNKLDSILKVLEKNFPDSYVFQVLSDTDDNTSRTFPQQKLDRAYALLEQVQSDDEKLKKSALKELQKMVSMARTNPDYRIVYAFALLTVGNQTEALNQAQLLVRNPVETHGFYLSIGQIFWHCGDPEKGKYYLELSLQYAQSEKDKQDSIELIAELSDKK